MKPALKSVALAPTRQTEPHIRITKAARDVIRAHPKTRQRLPLLGLYFALASEENDRRHQRGDPFTVSIAALADAAGMSPRAVTKHLPALVKLKLVKRASGRSDRVQNTYRLLSASAPAAARLVNRPHTFDDVQRYARLENVRAPRETLRAFWEHNEASSWQIPDPDGKAFRPCRDWKKLLQGWVRTHCPSSGNHAVRNDDDDGRVSRRIAPVSTRTRQQRSARSHELDPARVQRVCDLVGREYDRPWSREETDAFFSADLDTCDPERFAKDCTAIAAHYEAMANGRQKDYRRRSLLSLLSHWHEDVDKARFANSRPSFSTSGASFGANQNSFGPPPGFDPNLPHAHTGGLPIVA